MILIVQSDKSRHRRGWGFTLVELLAAIAVIVLLMVAGAPLLSDPANSGRQISREILRAHLQQARGHAIAKNHATALIIAGYGCGTPHDGRMLTIAEVEPQASGGSAFRCTQLLQRWTVLPENMFFLPRSAIQSSSQTLMDIPVVVDAEYQKRTIACHGVMFSPDGRVTHPADGAPLVLAIGRGASTKGGGVIATQQIGDQAGFDLLRINRLNARARLLDPRTTP